MQCLINGLKTLYVCLVAIEKGKSFDLDKFAQSVKGITMDYAWGYLVASSSIGVFNHTMTGAIVTITFMHDYVRIRLREEIGKRKGTVAPGVDSFRVEIEAVEPFIEAS